MNSLHHCLYPQSFPNDFLVSYSVRWANGFLHEIPACLLPAMDSETGSKAFLSCRDDRGRSFLSACYDLIGILRHASLNEVARLKNSLIEKWVNCMIFEVTFPSVLESYLFPAFSVKEVLISCHLTTLSRRLLYYIVFTTQMPYTMPYLCVDQDSANVLWLDTLLVSDWSASISGGVSTWTKFAYNWNISCPLSS